MKKCVLIGGGDIGRGNTSYQTEIIDKEIVNMTNKKCPVFLFIGLASSHADSYYDTIKKIYKNLGCETKYLKKSNLLNNPEIVKDKILSSDIIYIGGGDSIKLIEKIKEYNINPLLKEAYEKGTILVGISAGAIALSDKGISDSKIIRKESDKHILLDGLGYVTINICPHYHKNVSKTDAVKNICQQEQIEIIGLEDNTALKIIDGEMNIIKNSNENKIYKCRYKKCFIEEEITNQNISKK